jgi:hypothetical protein
VPWSDEPNRAYLRALDAQRRAALALGLDDQAARLADELASADAEAPARIASEFTPTQLMPIVASAGLFEPATGFDAHTGEPLAEPTAVRRGRRGLTCPQPYSSERNGATRARARRPTSWDPASTTW